MARVQLFIDGFNLYHCMMADPRLRKYRWLNFDSLARAIISKSDTLSGIYFFTAYYPGKPGKLARHKTYVDAQNHIGVTTVLGKFRRKQKYCPDCGKTTPGYEEKETDVNIAVHVLIGAALDDYDTCMVLSNDSDLIPVYRALRAHYPEKKLKLIFPPNHASNTLKAAVPDYMRLKEKHLRLHQFPDQVGSASKPSGW